jgi:nucleotide-binding universal stress UspA family protein
LWVTDGSSASLQTCEFLDAFPLPDRTGLEVLHVLPPVRTSYLVEPYGVAAIPIAPEDEARLRQAEELQGKMLLDLVREALAGHGLQAGTVLLRGDPVTEIVTYARE